MTTTTTITAKEVLANGLPAIGNVTNEDIGNSYLEAATRAARGAQQRVAKGQADLARVVYAVKTSGLGFFALNQDQRDALAADDDGRSTGFSVWYKSIGLTMQEANNLANYGRQLADGLPVANVGQSRAITALENANDAAGWRDKVREVVANIYDSEPKVTAKVLRETGREALDIAAPEPKVTEPKVTAPEPKVETLEAFARFVLHETTDAAAMVSGDLSGFDHTAWKQITAKLAALTSAVDDYRLAATRKETAPSV